MLLCGNLLRYIILICASKKISMYNPIIACHLLKNLIMLEDHVHTYTCQTMLIMCSNKGLNSCLEIFLLMSEISSYLQCPTTRTTLYELMLSKKNKNL